MLSISNLNQISIVIKLNLCNVDGNDRHVSPRSETELDPVPENSEQKLFEMPSQIPNVILFDFRADGRSFC